MKKSLVFILILSVYYSAFSQQEMIDRITKQAIEIDSLKKASKLHYQEISDSFDKKFDKKIKQQQIEIDSLNKVTKAYFDIIAVLNKKFQDSTKKINQINKDLKDELSDITKFKENKKNTENQIKSLNDSIFKYSAIILEKDKQKHNTDSVNRKKLMEEFNKGKQIVLDSILYSYKGKTFDTIIYSTSLLTVIRDKQLIGINAEVKQLFADLIIYFEARELLANKFDAAKIKNAQSQINLLKLQSVYISKLKEKLDNYQSFSNGLKDCLIKIIELDKKELVAGMSDEIKRRKLNKIFEISAYIFNYDFNFNDYPYLSDIVLELIKLKTPDADANISALIEKL